MICQNETQLKKALAGPPAGAWLFYGAEDYLKERYAQKLCDLAVEPAFASFNLRKLDGWALDWEDLLAEAQALPLMSPRKCIWVHQFDCDKLSAADFKKLEELLALAGEGCVLLFTMSSQVVAKRSKNLSRTVKLFDAHGTVAQLEKATDAQLQKLVATLVQKAGGTIAPPLQKLVVRRCGGDMRTVGVEASKLAGLCAGREVTEDDVAAVVCDTLENSVYDISRAILSGSCQKALEILQNLLYQRISPTVVLLHLSQPFLDLYRAKAVHQAGKTANEMVEQYGYQRFRFRAENALREEGRYTVGQLRGAVAVLVDADRRLKSTAAEPEVVLQQAIVSLFLQVREGGR